MDDVFFFVWLGEYVTDVGFCWFVMMSRILTPEFYWAQRKDLIFLTVNVPNVNKDQAKFKLNDDGHVYFKGSGGQYHNEHEYLLDIQLYKGIKASVSFFVWLLFL